MCGIAGICAYRGDAIKDIEKMNSMLYRRGPDAGSHWIDEHAKVVLGHRRLSIIDVSNNGLQPMVSRNERYVIAFNGEIYNFHEIKQRMEREHQLPKLKSTSDTEVILEAAACYGVRQTVEMMKGMFAIAWFDREEKKLYLTRDRVGEKPLYYGFVNGSFVFASDLAAIKKIEGFAGAVNTDALNLYFQYGYIPSPHTIYKNIYKLEAGSILEISAPFETYHTYQYWNMKEIAKKGQENLFQGTEAEAKQELERLLKEAVAGQMAADVPLGAFLSGGIDSSLIVSLMQAQSTQKIKSFTIGFEEQDYNEAEYAKEIAAYLGTAHTELYVSKQDALDTVLHLHEAFSEPFADSSQIPTMLVSKMTKEHVTVSLSGDAGDELFCGYNTYQSIEKSFAALQNRLKKVPPFVKDSIGVLAKTAGNAHTQRLYRYGRYCTLNSALKSYKEAGMLDSRTAHLSKSNKILSDSNHQYEEGYLGEIKHDMMLMDLLQYHPDDILVKVDRAGMYYSLETRIPLLDKDVVEFAWRLPLQMKYDNGVTKKILREILYEYVPREMLERPKKGFSVPLSTWLLEKGTLYEWAQDMRSSAKTKASSFINMQIADSYFEDFFKNGKWSNQVWYLLMFEQWLLQEGK